MTGCVVKIARVIMLRLPSAAGSLVRAKMKLSKGTGAPDLGAPITYHHMRCM